jgi:two-component system nitrogen regulation response regulator GlnG
MAPSQVIEPKDLPPEVQSSESHNLILRVETFDGLRTGPVDTLSQTQREQETMVQAEVTAMPTATATATHVDNWEQGMYKVAQELLATDRTDVWDEMTRRFETHLIQAALASSKGRRIDAAHKLGIGRNTITRKIQELGLGKE